MSLVCSQSRTVQGIPIKSDGVTVVDLRSARLCATRQSSRGNIPACVLFYDQQRGTTRTDCPDMTGWRRIPSEGKSAFILPYIFHQCYQRAEISESNFPVILPHHQDLPYLFFNRIKCSCTFHNTHMYLFCLLPICLCWLTKIVLNTNCNNNLIALK